MLSMIYNLIGKRAKIIAKEEKLRAKIIDKKVMCEEKNIYCGDKNAQVLTFETPCVIDGVNVENMPVYMKCENSLGKKCKTLLTSVKEGDNLIIEWILGEEATLISGKLKCQIVFEDQGGEVVLNFEVFELDIHPSVSENGPKITPEYNQITQLQNQLMALIRDGNLVLPEASAVDEGKILEVNGEGKWVKSEKKLNYLWKKEEEFRNKVKTSKGFCLEHFCMLITEAEKRMKDTDFKLFKDVLVSIQKENMERLDSELDWFIQKFDYRFTNEPWKNSKDSLERTILKISSTIL